MKFIRYGDLKAFDQKQYEKCPGMQGEGAVIHDRQESGC